MTEPPPEIPVVPARRSFWDRVSIIWLVPVAALVVALGIAWQNWSNRGPVIEITLTDASGVTPGETQLRFRDVGVGVVEGLEFTPDFDKVVVRVRLDPVVADYVDSDATFWVVRPQVTTQGITGLETVLTGVYIKGQWDTNPQGLVREFEGLPEAPLLSADEQGMTIVLRATEGGLPGNVPLVYKGVEVGRVGPARVTTDGFAVEAQAVVLAPWDALLTEATRFYNVSGFSFSLGTGGASINFESAATLLVGGISFDTWVSGAPLAREGHTYTVYEDSDIARSSVFNRLDGPPLYLSAIFEGNVTGLALGAPVELDGLRIGEVSGITGVVDRAAFGDGRVRLLTQLTLQPARLGYDGEEGPEQALALLEEQVAGGLRARLVTGSLLNGGLKVQLTAFPDMAPGRIDPLALPYPSIPVAPSEISDIQATAQGTLDRINALPIEELLTSAATFLDGAARLVTSEDIQSTPGDIRRVIASVEAVTTSQEVQAIPGRVDEVLSQLDATLAEARSLVEDLNNADASTRVLAAVDSTGAAMEEIRTAVTGIPGLVENLEGLVADARALGLNAIATEAEGLLSDARALIAQPGLQTLPDDLSRTLDEIEGLVAEIRQSGLVDGATAAVADIRGAVAGISAATEGLPALMGEAEEVLAGLRNATEGLPGLITTAEQVAANLAAADLSGLVTRAGDLVAGISDYIATPDMQSLPGAVNNLVGQATAIAEELNNAGVADRLSATLASVEEATDAISDAASGLPVLVEEARAVVALAGTAIAGLSDLGQTMRDVRTALREISRAADAVGSLATRLQRSPNSLIFGN